MKFLRNILIIGIVTIILFSISIRLAEMSSGNTVYIFIIAGCVIVFISRFLMNLNLWVSLKKQYDSTPEELVNKGIKMQKYYVPEIIMLVTGLVLFIYGYKEYIIWGFDRISIMYFLGSIISFFIVINGVINKKRRIEKNANTISEQNNLKRNNKIVIYFVIILIIMSFLYKFFN